MNCYSKFFIRHYKRYNSFWCCISSLEGVRKQHEAANEFLIPFLGQKEFLKRRREFELDMFKPETFAPIWAKSFDAVLKGRLIEAKTVLIKQYYL